MSGSTSRRLAAPPHLAHLPAKSSSAFFSSRQLVAPLLNWAPAAPPFLKLSSAAPLLILGDQRLDLVSTSIFSNPPAK